LKQFRQGGQSNTEKIVMSICKGNTMKQDINGYYTGIYHVSTNLTYDMTYWDTILGYITKLTHEPWLKMMLTRCVQLQKAKQIHCVITIGTNSLNSVDVPLNNKQTLGVQRRYL